jgi:hypothetical protein
MIGTKTDYFDTPEGVEILEALQRMLDSTEYITGKSYTPHSDELLTFIEKHKDFIRKHPNTDATQYVSNLKIMCRRR